MDQIFSLTQNTATAAQAATGAAIQSRITADEVAALKVENAELKKTIEEQNQQLKLLTAGQQQTHLLLAQVQQLLERNEAAEKKA